MGDLVLVDRALDRGEVGDVAGDVRDRGHGVRVEQQPQPPRLGREVEGDDRLPVGDELGDDPRADAAVGAGDEEARSLMRASSTTFANSAGRSTRFANASAPSASGAVESQSSGEVALGEDLERARELGARVGELAAQVDRAADELGHRERPLGVAEPEHHDRARAARRPRAPRATSARSRPRRRRGRRRPARARPRSSPRRAARRSRAARPAGRRR